MENQTVKEQPILFSGAMVKAILDGRKTQTRRVCKFPKYMGEVQNLKEHGELSGDADCPYSGDYNDPASWGFPYAEDGADIALDATWAPLLCPYGAPGDRLWVRETCLPDDSKTFAFYRADYANGDPLCTDSRGRKKKIKWTPSIHMPRWASRITLEITDVRVERLQDISAKDAEAEGAEVARDYQHDNVFPDDEGTIFNYQKIWEAINGAGSWEKNPWVWVVCFKRVKP